MLICTETRRTCDFPGGGGVWTPDPHSGSAYLLLSSFNFTLGRIAPSFKWAELVLGRVELQPFISKT